MITSRRPQHLILIVTAAVVAATVISRSLRKGLVDVIKVMGNVKQDLT
jgi:hypothetical protein